MKLTKQRICEILRSIDVPYFTEGKNVSPDSVNIKCPFCPDDPSDHLGIFEGSGIFSCWRCRKKGPLGYLLHVLTGLPREKCDEMIDDGSVSFDRDPEDQVRQIVDGEVESNARKRNGPVGLPECYEKITSDIRSPLLRAYMKRRDIPMETLMKHHCGICRSGRYMNRLIIPVIFNGSVVSFQAADMTGVADLKYDSAPNDINEYLYNYDNIVYGGRMILVEGVLDMWRVEDDCVASFGTHLTDKQKFLILNRHPSELIFLWDEDAYDKISKFNSEAGFFEPFIDEVRIIRLPKDEDPDSIGKEEVFMLIDGPEYKQL